MATTTDEKTTTTAAPSGSVATVATTASPLAAPTLAHTPSAEDLFKQRVVKEAIEGVQHFKDALLDWEYLVCSEAFVKKDYYIVNAIKGNYPHLVGVRPTITPEAFYDKCANKTLDVVDFDFAKKDPDYDFKSTKGTIRRKIQSLPSLDTMFSNPLMAKEGFKKNSVVCTFASATTSSSPITLGFVGSNKSKPMTLQRGNQLDSSAQPVELILRRPAYGKYPFSEVILGSDAEVKKYWSKIKDIVNPELKPKEPKDTDK